MQMQSDTMELKQQQFRTENVQVIARVNKQEEQVKEIAQIVRENARSVEKTREETNILLRQQAELAQNNLVESQNAISRNLVNIDQMKLVLDQQTAKVSEIGEQARNANRQSAENLKKILSLEPSKLDLTAFEQYKSDIDEKMKKLKHQSEDMFNRALTTDTYLEKYLPYNNFVQLFEIMHMALPVEMMKGIEDYESCKMQNYLADILLDLGKNTLSSGSKTIVSLPPDPNRQVGKKAADCKSQKLDFTFC